MDANHPDRTVLERYSRAGATPAEERWIESHLHSGCRVCQREVDALLATLSPSPADEPVPERGDGFARAGLFARLERRLAEVREERSEAPVLTAELLGHPGSQRRLLVCQAGRFQTLAVCELLIDASFQTGFRDPVEAVELAELSLLLARQLDAGYYGPSVVEDLQARACAYLGNARRIASISPAPRRPCCRPSAMPRGAPPTPLEEARILDFRASLLGDQGRFEQAAELLDLVIDIYDELNEAHRKGRAMISQGVFLGQAGGPEEGHPPAAQGALSRGVGARAAAGADGAAQPRLVPERQRPQRGGPPTIGALPPHLPTSSPTPGRSCALAWLSGRIAARLDYSAEAEQTLIEVRQRCLAEGHGYDASLVTLDLAQLYLRQGRSAEVRELAAGNDRRLPLPGRPPPGRRRPRRLPARGRARQRHPPCCWRKSPPTCGAPRRNPRLRFAGAAV